MINFDNRVGSKEFPLIPPLDSIPTETYPFKKYLTPGDCYFEGNGHAGDIQIGIEIKSLPDLLSSLNSARLQGQGVGESRGQILRMLEFFDITILIYYGKFHASEDDKPIVTHSKYHGPRYYWSSVHAALAEFQYYGVWLFRVDSKREVALLISTLYNFFQKPWNRHKLFRSFNTAVSGTTSRLISITSTIPHHIKVAAKILSGIGPIGYERALAISHHFGGDIAMIFGAMSRDSLSIANIKTESGRAIGPVISEAVYQIVKPRSVIDADSIANSLE